MESLKLFLIAFISIYLLYLFFVILSKKRVSKFNNNSYVLFLKNVYKVNTDKISNKVLANIVALSNSLILSLTLVTVDGIKEFYLKFILTVIIIIPLQLLIYYVIGKILKRKSGSNV